MFLTFNYLKTTGDEKSEFSEYSQGPAKGTYGYRISAL